MDLGRVAEHRGITSAEVALEAHLRRQRRGGCHQRLVDHRLHVDRHAFTGAAAAERQDALDQRLRAQRGAHRGIDVPALRRAFGAVALHQLAIAEDRGEDVVEVVRDAAGQRAHRLELLRLAQLRFEPVALGLGVLARGDVFERTGHPVRPALLVTQRDAALAEPDPAVRARVVEPVLDLPVRSAAVVEVGLQRVVHALLVVRVVAEHPPPLLARAHRFAGLQAEQFLGARGEEEGLAAHVPVPHAFVRPGDRQLVALLRLAQRLLGALVRVDVADRPRPTRRPTVQVAQVAAANAHPAPAAVALAHPAVGLLRVMAALRLTAKGPLHGSAGRPDGCRAAPATRRACARRCPSRCRRCASHARRRTCGRW